MKGEMPQQKDEIAIDRMYADNNDLQVGDVISVDKKELTVTGLVALSDYSALFSNSSDMMFDAVKFGVGIMTEEGYDAITDDHIKYCYSWKYDTEPKDENEEKEWSDNFVEVLAAHSSLTGYLPRYGNQAIKFTGDDMGGDKAMVEVLLYILIAIMAFIFAVTTNNTIVKEASVIGTLRASGYTRRELLLHYLSLPVLITILSAVIGNILGYTVFKDICAGMYYGSYSLPTYQTRWNANAFLLTTVIPAILMFVINAVLISGRLNLWFSSSIMEGLNESFHDEGYDISIYQMSSAEERRAFFDMLPVRRNVDAVIVISFDIDSNEIRQLRSVDVPIIGINSSLPEERGFNAAVRIDDKQGSELAARHLITLGHRDIAYIRTDREVTLHFSVQGRFDSFMTCCKSNGVEPRVFVTDEGKNNISKVVTQLLSSDHMPTAIACQEDGIAIPLLFQLERNGFTIPNDISIIGYDDSTYALSLIHI